VLAVSFYLERKETPVNEITSKNIRELDSVFKFYTVVTLLGAMTFISSIAVHSWIAAGISGAITLIGTIIAYRTEVEIEAQKVITQALSDARDVKVSALYGKETSDE
jgi:predicted membrane protein